MSGNPHACRGFGRLTQASAPLIRSEGRPGAGDPQTSNGRPDDGFTPNDEESHFFGRRRFATPDHSSNVFLLALPSLGESWHNNHHAFPTSAAHGLRWWEFDVSSLVIRALARVGLVSDVVEVSRERQARKAIELAGA